MDRQPIKTYPSWRKGWTWALLKSSAATLLSVVLTSVGLYLLLKDLVSRLPGWIPSPVIARIFQWLLAYVWVFGPLVGLAIGVLLSAVIIGLDARAGKLRRLK